MRALHSFADYLWSQSWQLAPVFVLMSLLCLALRKASAHWRYLLWSVVLLKCIVPAVVLVPMPVLDRVVEEAALVTRQASPAGQDAQAGGAAQQRLVTHSGGRESPAVRPALDPRTGLVAVWGAGAVVLLLVVMAKALRIQRDLRRARTLPDMELECEFLELVTVLKLRSRPRLCLIRGISQPFVWGIFRGCIYLPQGFAGQGTAQQRRLVIAHELAHVLRWDALANFSQVLIQAIFWFHPLVWWLNRIIRLRGFNQVDRAKPGAVVLLEHPNIRTAHGPAVILAAQEVGKGRAVAFTSDSTYWWGELFETIWGEPINPRLPLSEANCDSRYFQRFWVNTVRWLAAHKLEREMTSMTIELAGHRCAPNREVAARVQVFDRDRQVATDADVAVSLENASRKVETVQAVFRDESRTYEAVVRPTVAGRYTVRAAAKRKDGTIQETRQLLVCEELDWEMADIRARPDWLADISRWSGGRVFAAKKSEPVVIEAALGGATPATIEYRRQPLWDTWVWLSAIVGLLTLEWVARRVRGLA